VLSLSYDEAAERSRARCETIAAWAGWLAQGGFGWVTPPVLNPYTRIAVEMCAANGTLRVVGYESTDGSAAQPATLPCDIDLARVAA
jgi:hypothetical protein